MHHERLSRVEVPAPWMLRESILPGDREGEVYSGKLELQEVE